MVEGLRWDGLDLSVESVPAEHHQAMPRLPGVQSAVADAASLSQLFARGWTEDAGDGLEDSDSPQKGTKSTGSTVVSNWRGSFHAGRDRFNLSGVVSNWPGSFHHGWGVWNVER